MITGIIVNNPHMTYPIFAPKFSITYPANEFPIGADPQVIKEYILITRPLYSLVVFNCRVEFDIFKNVR